MPTFFQILHYSEGCTKRVELKQPPPGTAAGWPGSSSLLAA